MLLRFERNQHTFASKMQHTVYGGAGLPSFLFHFYLFEKHRFTYFAYFNFEGAE
jgi:hypothetical protein